MKQYKNRNEVEEKYKWDLSEYYKNDDEFFVSYNKLDKELDILKDYVGCTKDSNKLYEYLNKEKSTFGNPSKEVKELVPYLKKDAKILDVGCGDGRHALYLVSLGFQVDAFDLSKNAIEKIDYLKQKNNLNIHTRVCDVLDYPFRYSYDLIIVHGVLQFIDKTKQPQVIELLKKWTNVNGYHVIALFTDEEPIPDDLKDVMVGVFKNEEIKDYYTNWKTLMFENKKFHDEHENGIKHLHAMNKLVVKKIG